jgi:hypothetical protein
MLERRRFVRRFVLGLFVLLPVAANAQQAGFVAHFLAPQIGSTNPLFPATLGLPWFGVPEPPSFVKPFALPGRPESVPLPLPIEALPLSTLSEPQLSVFISGNTTLQREIASIGGICVERPLLPFNPIAARLMSFGFFLRAPRPGGGVTTIQDH